MKAVVAPSRLHELAHAANAAHAKVRGGAMTMLEYAIEAGEALTAAKAQLEHGEWLPWLDRNFLWAFHKLPRWPR